MSSSAQPKTDSPDIQIKPAADQTAEHFDEKSNTETELEELFGAGTRMGHGIRRHGHGLYPEKRRVPRKRGFDED